MAYQANNIAQTPTTNPTDTLVTKTVRDFMVEGNLTLNSNPTVLMNTNGYPYITFISKDNKAENIYFSKSAGEKQEAGAPIVRGFFNDLQMVRIDYTDARESRWKISTLSSNRVTVEDLF